MTYNIRSLLFSFSILFGVALCAEESYQFTGSHFMASYKECDHKALTNIPQLRQALIDAAKASGAQILDKCEYIFEPDGFTMVILLSESHASIHTYPEHNACFVDLFTCGHNCSSEAFHNTLQKYLKAENVDSSLIPRN